MSARANTLITPAGWTFGVAWSLIYLWQGLWLLYDIATIFIKTNNGYLYRQPSILTPIFHFFIIANFAFNITWLFIFAEEKFWVSIIIIKYRTQRIIIKKIYFKKPSFAVLALIVLTLYISLVISHRNIYDADVLFKVNQRYIWLYRIFVNNGLAFYATWVTIATMLNFAIALTYDSDGKIYFFKHKKKSLFI